MKNSATRFADRCCPVFRQPPGFRRCPGFRPHTGIGGDRSDRCRRFRRLAWRRARGGPSDHAGRPALAVREPVRGGDAVGDRPARRRRAASAARLRGLLVRHRPGPAAHPADRAERRHFPRRKRRRADPRVPRRRRRGAAGATTVFASGLEPAVRHRVLAAGPDRRGTSMSARPTVVRYPYKSGDLEAAGRPRSWCAYLPDTASHWTRDMVFSPDGGRMFVSVGSAGNTTPRCSTETRRTEGLGGRRRLGAAWGDEEDRADVLVFDPDGGEQRGCSRPACATARPRRSARRRRAVVRGQRADGLGDNLPPDYATRVRDGRVLRLAVVLHRRPSGPAAGWRARPTCAATSRCRTC